MKRNRKLKLKKIETKYCNAESRLMELDAIIVQISELNPDLYDYVLYINSCSNKELNEEMEKIEEKYKDKILYTKQLFEERRRLFDEYIKMSKSGYLNKINVLRKNICKHILIRVKEMRSSISKRERNHIYCPKCCIDSLNIGDIPILFQTHNHGIISDGVLEVEDTEVLDQLYMRAIEEGIDGDSNILSRMKVLCQKSKNILHKIRKE